MPDLKRPTSVVLISAALVAVTGFAAASASTAPKKTWAITPGGAVAATTKSFTVEDITADGSMHCRAAVVKVKLKSGKGLSGTGAGTVTSASFTGCSVDGIGVTVKAGHLPWHLNLVSYNSATGVATATLTGIHMNLAVPAFGCSGVVDGTGKAADDGVVRVTYTNKTAKLTTLKAGGHLRLYHVQNCDGLVNDGDSIAIGATFSISPKQKITSS